MIGKTLAHYEIAAFIGKGGMGEVYRARDTKLDRDVALKVLQADVANDPGRLDRFEREAKTVAGISHPNIVTLHSVEEAQGIRFLTMELVEGEGLDQILTPDGLPLAKVFEIGTAVADALAAAHDRGIVHRDLKPANVMVTADGHVKVLDFGLAKLAEDKVQPAGSATEAFPITAEGSILGTVPYMSPEQLRGHEVDHRSDIFSLGILIYELATGRRPFGGATNADVTSAILKESPPVLTLLKPALPRHLGRIVAHCLEKDSKDRYQSALDVRNELRGLQREVDTGVTTGSGLEHTGTPSSPDPTPSHPGMTAPTSTTSEIHPGTGSRGWVWALGGAGIVIIAVAAFWFGSRSGSSERMTSPSIDQLAGEIEDEVAKSVDTDGQNSLAVLPFQDLSRDQDQEYFADGLSEDLMSALARVEGLRVAGRTSSFAFKDNDAPLQAIGEQLRVAHVLEGSVRKARGQVRVNVQLVKASDGFQLWSETYDRTLDDIFAVQDDIAASVANAMELTLLGAGAGGPIPDAKAYDMVLQARFVMTVRTENAVRRAREILDRALEISPDYALAWAELGLLHRRELEMSTSIDEAQRLNRQVKNALERALELDPDLAEAHSRMAGVLLEEWDFAGALRATERALAADPNSPIVLGNAAVVYMDLGRCEEALRLATKVADIDPIDHLAHSAVSDAARLSGRMDVAKQALDRAAKLAPKSPMVHYRAATLHLLHGDAAAAKTSFDRFNELAQYGDYGRLFATAMIQHTAGNETASANAAHEFENVFGDEDPASCAEIRAWRGEDNAAFDWLEKALEVRDGALCEIKTDPFLATLHDDQRWDALLQKIGLPPSR